MSTYRDRFTKAKAASQDRGSEQHLLEIAYRNTFSTPEGQTVLDHICQNICGLDAVVNFTTDREAIEALVRKNIGLTIARFALGPASKPTKPEVNT